MTFKYLGYLFVLLLLAAAFILGTVLFKPAHALPAIFFNQSMIEKLGSALDLNNPDEVFKHVFLNLPERPVVYPTENYYYFQFYAGGKTIWGNLRFDAQDRDKGALHLGYFEYSEDGQYQDYAGHSKAFNQDSGVTVLKVDPWHYQIKAFGKTVVFTLNDVGWALPQKAKLRPGEEYVGTIYDESGLRFFLVFNGGDPHLFYVLDEDAPAPEEFLPIEAGPPTNLAEQVGGGAGISPNVVMGKRTGYAFFNDPEYNQKILIGVSALNMQRNNYYDGPFDQLPDNYVLKTQIAKYMGLAYPGLESEIDQYGVFKNQEGSRMAITSYFSYYSEADFSFVESCAKTYPAPEDQAKFITCITPNNR